MANKASAAFIAAGGGKDGIDAMNKVKTEFQEDERRKVSGELIETSFPNATPAELEQLKATMDTAPTTGDGLTKAKEKNMNTIATVDALTSLYNRRWLDSTMVRVMAPLP